MTEIVLFVYNRPEHTARTLAALAEADGANALGLTIFADAACGEADAPKVERVRQICSKANGFAQIRIVERTENYGLAKNVVEGVSDVFAQAQKVIVLEDDIEVQRGFLTYMTAALDFYQSKNVFAIGGYTPPISMPEGYPYSTYVVPRNCSWGWATWRDRWASVDWQVSDFDEFIHNRELRCRFALAGNDLPTMLLKQRLGQINSWSVRFCYAGFRQQMNFVYPTTSLVRNAGADGSGTHVQATKRYDSPTAESIDASAFCPDTTVQNVILQRFAKFYNVSMYRRVVNFFKLRRNL